MSVRIIYVFPVSKASSSCCSVLSYYSPNRIALSKRQGRMPKLMLMPYFEHPPY